MNEFLLAALCAAGTAALCLFLFEKSKKVSLYRYRNIWLIACLPALFIVELALLNAAVWGETELSGLAYEFPGYFAQLSVTAFSILFVLMAISNIALLRHEGMSLHNMVGTFLQFLFIAGTVAVYLFVRITERAGVSPGGVWDALLFRFLPLYLYSLLDYCECIMLGIIVLGWIAARQQPAYDKDFIIIPGCSIRKDGGLLPLLRGRVNRAIRYAWDQEIATQKPVAFVPSGGQGADEIMSEGSAMALYLMSHGAEESEVFPEKESANTRENFALSRQIIDAQKPGARVAFATTNYHMLRCGFLARAAGMEAEGIASGTKWYFWPNGFAR